MLRKEVHKLTEFWSDCGTDTVELNLNLNFRVDRYVSACTNTNQLEDGNGNGVGTKAQHELRASSAANPRPQWRRTAK